MNSIRLKRYYKRTKIIATMGPAITQKLFDKKSFDDIANIDYRKIACEKMEGVIMSGVTCCRLNFSHGSYDEHQVRIDLIRAIAKKTNRNISIMLDTKGPEIRVGKIENGPVLIKQNNNVTIYTSSDIVGDAQKFSVSDSSGQYNMAKDVKVDDIILIDDGKLQLKITNVDAPNGKIVAHALNTHSINDKKRINLPDVEYSMPFLSKKDIDDIIYGIKNNVDYIAASFVNSANDVNEIRNILIKNNGEFIQIIAKIETSNAVKNIDEILKVADGIMIARGDLALEIPYYDVPYWQKYIIRKCRIAGKPVIVATQMLDSLERNIQPTRAEVTDVYFAVDRGADCTMLSGESAQGQFPVQAVYTMRRINKRSELLFDYKRSIKWYFPQNKSFPRYSKKIAIKIARECLPFGDEVAPTFKYNFVIMFTNDEITIRAISTIRPAATIIVVTDDKNIITKFGINYAIQTHYVDNLEAAKINCHEIARTAINRFEPEEKQVIMFINGKFKRINE